MSLQVREPRLGVVEAYPDMPKSVKKLLLRMAEERGVRDGDVVVRIPVPRDPLVFVRGRLVAGWFRP